VSEWETIGKKPKSSDGWEDIGNDKQKAYNDLVKARMNFREGYQKPINMPDQRMTPVKSAVEFGLGIRL